MWVIRKIWREHSRAGKTSTEPIVIVNIKTSEIGRCDEYSMCLLFDQLITYVGKSDLQRIKLGCPKWFIEQQPLEKRWTNLHVEVTLDLFRFDRRFFTRNSAEEKTIRVFFICISMRTNKCKCSISCWMYSTT